MFLSFTKYFKSEQFLYYDEIKLHTHISGYPAKTAVSAMRKHGG